MSSYVRQLKELIDTLAYAGEKLDDFNLVAHTLQGLLADDDAFATSIRVCVEPIMLKELHGYILSEEVEYIRRQ